MCELKLILVPPYVTDFLNINLAYITLLGLKLLKILSNPLKFLFLFILLVLLSQLFWNLSMPDLLQHL
jgi:hypothetical protein